MERTGNLKKKKVKNGVKRLFIKTFAPSTENYTKKQFFVGACGADPCSGEAVNRCQPWRWQKELCSFSAASSAYL